MKEYIVKFDGREETKYASENGWRCYAEDGLCEYILDAATGEVVYTREFYIKVSTPSDKIIGPFPTYDRAFSYAMRNKTIVQFAITKVNPKLYQRW